MRVPQRLDYALRALVLLAAQPAGEYVAAGDLTARLGLPRRFVEQQISALARVGIVSCRRGAAGGCALAKGPDVVTVLDVVEALQGEALDVPRVTGSAVSVFWGETAETLATFMRDTTLAELAERQREIDGAASTMYWI